MEKLTNALLGLALFAAAALAGYAYGNHQAAAEAAEAERGRTAQALEQLRKEDARVLEREKAKRLADNDTFTTYKEQHEHADQKTTAVIAGLRADAIRLRIPVRPTGAAAPAAGGSTAGGSGEEGYAEPTAEFSVSVVGLLARGDEAIRKHAAVVDLYEHLRAACAAPAQATP